MSVSKLVETPTLAAALEQRPDKSIASNRITSLWRSGLRVLFVSMLTVYVGWNSYWLFQGTLAPSLFQSLTGLPCPTTGCTRSFLSLSRGEWQESLRFNAFLVPICLLLVASFLQISMGVVSRRRLSLSHVLVSSWGIVLLLAWILKLAGDPRYW
ncbi:MAG: DUF2752 domain-containing protein [Pirellulaceae bacterium]